ncbi:hypothetical protein AB1K54_16515 [Microbacterium sp. BWT-B31]|uniref:hypothetical protein n=1 Tax=Microbacterium sp. BWT-B31 TaxID=3232072 RepID=UPI0035298791
MTEQGVLQSLISKWVSLASEYASGAPDVRAYYIYGASEKPGVTYINVLFEQAGSLVYPSDLVGANASIERASLIQRLFRDDLFEARAQFEALGVQTPTEYRVYYEPATRKLDVQVSRELIYRYSDREPGTDGFHRWLGDRAPKLF